MSRAREDYTHPTKMKPSNSEEMLLSKSSAKLLLVRNAIDDGTLKKEARMLQKERKAGQRLYVKTREHLLQQRSKVSETNQRPLSSRSSHVENAVTQWKRDTNMAKQLSPQPKRKQIDVNKGGQMLLSSSFPSLSEGADKQPDLSPRSRNRALTSLGQYSSTTSSLPDIHAASSGKIGGKKYTDTIRPGQAPVSEETGRLGSQRVPITDDEWKELQKCRYLRTYSARRT